MNQHRCPHFSVTQEKICVDQDQYVMRVPVYHCALAQIIAERLRSHAQGEASTGLLTTRCSAGENVAKRGPDYGPISPVACRCDRFNASCAGAMTELTLSQERERSLVTPLFVPA